MSGKNQLKAILVVLLGISMFCSCSKDDISGSVGGTVSIYHPDLPEAKTPMEGVRVMLVNMDYVVDSNDYSHNEAAVVGYATTDSDGNYLISDIAIGNYAVIPIPDSIMYRFEPENDSDSVEFSVQKEMLDFSFDFSAPEKLDDQDDFQIRVTIINRSGGGSIKIERPFFLFNIFPTYSPVAINGAYSSDADDMTLYLHFGIFSHLYVVSNNLRINAFDKAGYYLFTRWIPNDFFNTPRNSHWQINWSAQSISRIE